MRDTRARARARLPSAVCRLPSAVCRLPSAVCRLPSAVCRLPSAVCRLPSAVCRLPSAVGRRPSADRNDRSRPFFTPCARHAHRVGERIRCAPRDERIGDARLRMIADPRPLHFESPLCRACVALLPRRALVTRRLVTAPCRAVPRRCARARARDTPRATRPPHPIDRPRDPASPARRCARTPAPASPPGERAAPERHGADVTRSIIARTARICAPDFHA